MAPPKILPSAEYLHQCFIYRPRLGTLTWRRRPREHFPTAKGWKVFNTRQAGTIAGWITPVGYRAVEIDGLAYMVARIIWRLQTGDDPPVDVDHKNRKRADNRWRNLRLATDAESGKNKGVYKNNNSGFTGVFQRGDRYRSYVNADGVRYNVGTFDTREEAAAARDAAARRLFGEFYRA